MNKKQFKNAGVLFAGQLLIKGGSFLKQLLLAFFLGVSAQVDLLLVAQIVPAILASMIAGGAGEVLVTTQKKGKVYNEQFVVVFIFSIALITIVLGGLYLLATPLFESLFNISFEQKDLFWAISIIIVISKVPAAFVSGLQHLLYAKDKYNYFVISSLVAEIAGILTIVFLVDSLGILAFAYGLLVTPTVNALFFIYAHQLRVGLIFKVNVWLAEKAELLIVMKRVFSLSLQTLMNQLSTFWERTLSFRYLTPGFLSALNYSKSLSELPKMAMLSSVLTTTYIEQVNKKTENQTSYLNYTNKMEKLLSEISFLFQILSIVFGPLILIMLFQRGEFNTQAVERTFLIYQILTVGFVPGLMMNFLSRTMYIETEYRKLFYVILAKFIIEASIMIGFVQLSSYSIPIALVIGKFFVSIVLFWILIRKHKNIFNVWAFIKIYAILLILSSGVIIFNIYALPYILSLSKLELLSIYSPLIIISILMLLFLVKKRYGVEVNKLFSKKKK